MHAPFVAFMSYWHVKLAFYLFFVYECILTVWHGWLQPAWKLSGATRDNIFARKCQKKVMWTCLEKPEMLQRQDFQTPLNKQTCGDLSLIKKKKKKKQHPTWTGVCVCLGDGLLLKGEMPETAKTLHCNCKERRIYERRIYCCFRWKTTTIPPFLNAPVGRQLEWVTLSCPGSGQTLK